MHRHKNAENCEYQFKWMFEKGDIILWWGDHMMVDQTHAWHLYNTEVQDALCLNHLPP